MPCPKLFTLIGTRPPILPVPLSVWQVEHRLPVNWLLPVAILPLEELEELVDELDELDELLLDEELDEDELLPALRTRMELRLPLSVLVVTLMVTLPSVIFASNGAGFQRVVAPTCANISTLSRTVWPSMATSNERAPADVWYSSTKPSSTETLWLVTGISKVKSP
jgi:hypothetical protein